MARESIQLIVPEEISDATLPLKWRVPETILESIKQRVTKSSKPYLLISVSIVRGDHCIEINRHLVPLEDTLCYVQLPRPGKISIIASVIWDYTNDQPRPLDVYLRKSNNCYTTDVISFYDGKSLIGEYPDRIIIEVPGGVFAKDPPAWQKKLVDWVFDTKSRDQCHHRKRMMIAPFLVALLGILAVIASLIKIIIIIALFVCGMRGLKFGQLFHPLSEPDDWNEIWRYNRGSVFAALIRKFVGLFRGKTSQEQETEKIKLQWARAKQKALETNRLEAQRLAHLSDNVVAGGINTLPPEKQTIRLRFADFKAKVCRPFAN